MNPAADGSGLGSALVVFDDPTVSSGSVFHIKLEDLTMRNFAEGILLRNTFDILIENCFVAQCQNGLKCETTATSKLAGQIKVVGGMFLNNEAHIAIRGVTGAEFDHIELFGFTCGHKRALQTTGSVGISLKKSTGGVFAFGSHFEDLEKGILVNSGVFVGVTSVVGCKFITIASLGAGIDFSAGSANAIATIGNVFRPNTSTFLKAPVSPYLFQGFMAGANERATNNVYPTLGLLEAYGADAKSALRLATYSNATRPSASSLIIGSVIFNSDTKKLNIVSPGAVQPIWVDALGNAV